MVEVSSQKVSFSWKKVVRKNKTLSLTFLQKCLFVEKRFCLALSDRGGGQICPTLFQTLIPLEPYVGLTPNQAVNSSLSVVLRPI